MASDKVRCGICERRCQISPGMRGFCRTKANISGDLYTLAFGDISALESRPIEIKPFFHYHPGSTALTFSTLGCNFRCPWCQNHHLSRNEPEPKMGNFVPPIEMVGKALRYGDLGLCVSFQEPTLLFEYCLKVFPLAREKGLYNCFVSNGYQTESALDMLFGSGLDGLKIDIKGDKQVYEKHCGEVDVDRIWRNAQKARKMGLHVEIVNLLVTDENDDENCIDNVIDNHLKYLDDEVPLHFTRYHPTHKFHNPSTKIDVLERAYESAKKKGIRFPYLGNVHGHEYENTYCPDCGKMLVKRYRHRVIKYRITKDKKCDGCASEIPITGLYGG